MIQTISLRKILRNNKIKNNVNKKCCFNHAFLARLLGIFFVINVSTASVIRNNIGTGAVVSNGAECSPIGNDILKKGGNAIDAAIACLICEGITGSQNNGIGGGFLATVYKKDTNTITTLNAREAAPEHSTRNMFEGLRKIKGGHASAIPGEIRGYWELKKAYGSEYPWEKLFEPSIKLCEEGYKVGAFLGRILRENRVGILKEPTLREIFVNPKTNMVYKEGEIAKRPQLAETLRNISKNGADEFYGGVTGQNFIDDVTNMGGILTRNDLIKYRVKWSPPVQSRLSDDHTLYTIPIPGSGAVLAYILNLVKNRVEDVDNSTRTHRIIEAFKHGYGFRSQLADVDYEPSVQKVLDKYKDQKYQESILAKIFDNSTSSDPMYYGGIFEQRDHGTSNIAVLDSEGNAIVVTSTINNVFGAFVRSPKTGIILNDQMDDFSTPHVPNSYGFEPTLINFIKPGKRPMSSMSPSIILDNNGNVRLLIGAAGGSQITTSVALTIIRHLYLNQPLESAINEKRLHHQLVPMKIEVEEGFPNDDVLVELRKKGHKMQKIPTMLGFGAVTGISVINGEVTPVYDARRGGSAVTTA